MHTTGSAKAVRTAAVPAHATIDRMGMTKSIPGRRPGAPCFTDGTVDVKCGESRDSTACRKNSCASRPRKNI